MSSVKKTPIGNNLRRVDPTEIYRSPKRFSRACGARGTPNQRVSSRPNCPLLHFQTSKESFERVHEPILDRPSHSTPGRRTLGSAPAAGFPPAKNSVGPSHPMQFAVSALLWMSSTAE